MATDVALLGFPHRRAGHCGSGALRDLLEYHRLDDGRGPLSEGAVFGLAGGLGFLFLELPAMSPPVYLVGRTADLERDVSDHLGIGLETRAKFVRARARRIPPLPLGIGLALARLELKILVEETVKRFPQMTISGEPSWVISQFSSQLKHLPVKLHA